jgi:hypothetical protein
LQTGQQVAPSTALALVGRFIHQLPSPASRGRFWYLRRMQATGLIPRNRLKWIPQRLRFAHELCYFLHDECARILVEAEAAKADHVTINFRSKVTAQQFNRIANEQDAIKAMRATGYPRQARRVIMNRITMAMVSDCLHHLFEALRCMEKRKSIVALNLFRKPLRDNLLYLAWMLGDEDDFYSRFSSGDPEFLSPRRIGNHRKTILSAAIGKTGVNDLIEADRLIEILYDRRSPHGLEGYFQHAVHLITIENIELRTSPENFNFIFKSAGDDDVYEIVYLWLPYVLLFLSHIVVNLFDRMQTLDSGGKAAFTVRSKSAYLLCVSKPTAQFVVDELQEGLECTCDACEAALRITLFNAGTILLRQQYRCPDCQHVSVLPFTWLF